MVSCASSQKTSKDSPFNPVTVKESLKRGSTTKKEVLNVFGPPNILVESKTGESWTYQKERTDKVENSMGAAAVSFLPIPVLPTLVGGYLDSEAESTAQKSYALTVDFDKQNRVVDYKVVQKTF